MELTWSTELMDLSTEGGEASFYTLAGELRRIETVLYGEMGNTRTTYNITDAGLVVREVSERYSSPIYTDHHVVCRTTTETVVLDPEWSCVDLELYEQLRKEFAARE